MFVQEQLKNLAALLHHLHRLTGLKFSLHDADGQEIYTSSSQSAFCTQIKRAEGGYARCLACDRERILGVCQSGEGLQRYRCHAGLIEVAVPVMESGRHVATVIFGQFLDQSPFALQWENTRSLCSWHPHMDALYDAFCELRVISPEDLESCSQILHACVSEARLQGLPATAAATDGERLLSYIDRCYAMPLSLGSLCQALSIGKTKLCAVAKSVSGLSVSQLISARRVRAAQELLKTTEFPIQEIAEKVGIPDYNYFSKVFKSACGFTPSAYRRRFRA